MALGTVTEVKKGVVGDLKYAVLDVQLTSGANYTDNGETFGVAQVPGFTTAVYFVSTDLADLSTPANGYVTKWDSSEGKLVVYASAASGNPLLEVTANTDLSTYTARLFVLGE